MSAKKEPAHILPQLREPAHTPNHPPPHITAHSTHHSAKKALQDTKVATHPHEPAKEQPSQPTSPVVAAPKASPIIRMRAFFAKHLLREEKKSTPIPAQTPKEEDPRAKAERLIKKLQAYAPKKKARPKLQRRSLQEYLIKAGHDTDAARVRRGIFYGMLCLFALATAYVLVNGALWGADAWDVLLFLAAMWTLLFVGALFLVQGITYFYLDYRIYRRTKELEDVLPDFLQLASANIAAGMPIDRALWYSIRPNFGVLAKEMEEVAKATMSGESLETSLLHFSEKYESVLLKRSVGILIEGMHSGGEMADLLNKIALNIQEIKIMKQEMAANVTTYTIFIMVACVAIAPVLFALATQLLVIIAKITASIDLSSSQSFFSMNALDPLVIRNFTLFSYALILVSTVFGASIVSVIRTGTVFDGIKLIPVYTIIALIIYAIAKAALGSLFGNII